MSIRQEVIPTNKKRLVQPLKLAGQAEAGFFILLMIASAFVRFYDLSYRVYGLDADESKWTIQSWYSAILRIDMGQFSSMHYQYQPVSFWVRSVFLRVFGIDFFSARLESAILSLISVGVFYFLVRLITGKSIIALLSSLFYSFSFMELSASHQALHNTTSEIWIFSALFFLFLGIQRRKIWQFQLLGILLALGMLTYETFYPTVFLVIIYLLGLTIYDLVQRKKTVRRWFLFLITVIWPVALSYFGFTRNYITSRSFYHFGAIRNAIEYQPTIAKMLGFFFGHVEDVFETIFVRVVWVDWLVNWQGPLINPLLAPFIIIGFFYSIWNFRRSHCGFVLLWFFLNIIPGPILLASVQPRVMYSALAPLMVFGAMGIWGIFSMPRTLLAPYFNRLVVLLVILLSGAILANDYLIFSSKLIDPIERQKRRELADMTSTSAYSTSMLLLPYFPGQSDSVKMEPHLVLFSVAGDQYPGLEAVDHLSYVPFEDLLASLWEYQNYNNLDILFDKDAISLKGEREKIINTLLKCYPDIKLKNEGRFFNLYHLDKKALGAPVCYSPAVAKAIVPKGFDAIQENKPITFIWDTGDIVASSFDIRIERKRPDIHWIEVEEAFQGTGWYLDTHSEYGFTVETESAYGFTGEGFLLEDGCAGEAKYVFDIASSGQYRVWIRSYTRLANDQRNYISINGEAVEFSKNNLLLMQWIWEDVGVFDLKTGSLPISLFLIYEDDEMFSMFIDSIVLTTDLTYNPEKDDIWESVVDTGEMQVLNNNKYTLEERLPSGHYRWQVRCFDEAWLVDEYGERGIVSIAAPFIIDSENHK